MNKLINQANFGVAGFPPNFFNSQYRKKRENIFEWLNKMGLDWIELQNTYGVKMKDAQAELYKNLAKDFNIGISIHAPYFITLASADEEVIKRSKERILQCVALAQKLDSHRIIFHPGFFPRKGENDRVNAVEKIIAGLNDIESLIPDGVYLYPETAGKKTQIGSVDEIITICANVNFAKPCIDVAHVHGFENGTMNSIDNIERVLTNIEYQLGYNILMETHFHMYPVEIDHNGEKRHKAFEDKLENNQISMITESNNEMYYNPRPENFIEALARKNISPVVICEAKDTQDSGALLLKQLFYQRTSR